MAYAFRMILPFVQRMPRIRSQLYGSMSRSFANGPGGNDHKRLGDVVRGFSQVSTEEKPITTVSIKFDDRFLHIPTGTRDAIQINTTWLRDHCQCKICYNSATNQRQSNILCMKEKPKIADAIVDMEGDPKIRVTWHDGHESTYKPEWIKSNWLNPKRPVRSKQILWSGLEMKNRGGLPTVPYSDIIEKKNDALKELIKNIVVYGVGCVSNVPVDFEETKRVCEIVAMPEETVFGRFWKFSAELMEHADTAYTNMALGAHTDLTYYDQTAGIQVFHLLEHTGGKGGETLLVDGFNAAMQLRMKDPKAFQFLSTKPIPCHYLEHGAYHYSEEPVINVHPLTGELKQFRFNTFDRAPLNTFSREEEIEEFYRSYIALVEMVKKPENEFWVQLKPGTIAFIDNFRVMHGRSEFTGKRVLCGCYLQRDSFLSKARIVGN